jgi:hypothetical protein
MERMLVVFLTAALAMLALFPTTQAFGHTPCITSTPIIKEFGPSPQSDKCYIIDFQDAWTTTDAQYSHDDNALIEAYLGTSWEMTTTVWAEVAGNKLAWSEDYATSFSFGYSAQGQTTFYRIGIKYQRTVDYYSGWYEIKPYSKLDTIYVQNMGDWDFMSVPAAGSPNTQTVLLDPGLNPVSMTFQSKMDSTVMLQLSVGVTVFGVNLQVGMSQATGSSVENQVTITLSNPGSTTVTWRIYWEFKQDQGGTTYGAMAHVWRVA